MLLLILLNPTLGSPNAGTETSESRVGKSLVQGRARRTSGSCPKCPKLLEEFQQNIFKGKVKRGCGWLLQISWCHNPLFLQLFLQKTDVTLFVNFHLYTKGNVLNP